MGCISYLETHPQNGLLDHVGIFRDQWRSIRSLISNMLPMDREPGDYLRLLMHRAQTTCKTGGLSSNPALCHCKCNFVETICSQYFTKYLTQYLITYLTKYLTMIYFSVFFLTLNVEVWFRSPLEDGVAIHRSKHNAGHLEPPWNQMIFKCFSEGFPSFVNLCPEVYRNEWPLPSKCSIWE